jgi:hypothetical protein
MKKSIMALSAALFGDRICSKVVLKNTPRQRPCSLQNDPSAPVVITSVMYHVGQKWKSRTHRFCSLFWTPIIWRYKKTSKKENGLKYVVIVVRRDVFPSNNLELGLWMESERVTPNINQIGVDTQNEVVKITIWQFSLRTNFTQVKKNILKHPYRWTTIGSMSWCNSRISTFNKILHSICACCSWWFQNWRSKTMDSKILW